MSCTNLYSPIIYYQQLRVLVCLLPFAFVACSPTLATPGSLVLTTTTEVLTNFAQAYSEGLVFVGDARLPDVHDVHGFVGVQCHCLICN